MSKFHVITVIVLVLAATAAVLLGGAVRWIVLGVILAGYLAALSLGVVLLRLQFFCPVLWRGPAGKMKLALTFDDGPDPDSTPALLALLQKKNVRAAFFCVGERVERHPDVAKRIHGEGHLIGNHTHRHSVFTNFYFTSRLAREIERAQQAIARATGLVPRFYRPPAGLTNPHAACAVRRLGLDVIGWQSGRFDRNSRAPAAIIKRIVRTARDGGIVALHDQDVPPDRLCAIVEGLIEAVRREGYQLVRLDELLDRPAYREVSRPGVSADAGSGQNGAPGGVRCPEESRP